MIGLFAATSLEDRVFNVVKVLRVPVLVLALLALAIAIFEAGSLCVELWRRRRQGRRARAVKAAARAAHDALGAGDQDGARASLDKLASSAPMWSALQQLVTDALDPMASDWMSKTIADFDLRMVRRLERTRVLVRVGPALGLMGTLIPLSPALAGLAQGKVDQLTANLRIAFSVTVVGLLAGAIAFWVSMIRDRLYSQDVSDLETVAADLDRLSPGAGQQRSVADVATARGESLQEIGEPG